MDDADRAEREIERSLKMAVQAARGDIPPGKQGECDMCGEWSGRLIEGLCAPCRDLEAQRQARKIGK